MKEQHRGLTALLLVLAAVIGVVHWGHGPEFGADDHGQYLLHARNIVEGRPYTDIGFLHSRYTTMVAPIAEPPGLPVLIAAVMTAIPDSPDAARGILYFSLAVLGVVVFRYFRNLASSVTALIVASWTLVALGRLHTLDTMLADLPFTLFLWIALTLADGAPVRGARRLIPMALAGAAAFTFRMAALPLLPAAATALFVREREERRGFLLLGATWAVAAAAVMWGLPAAEVLAGETMRSPATIAADIAVNARAMWEGSRMWIPFSLSHKGANLALHLAVIAVAAMGAVIALRAQPKRFAYVVAAWYLVMLVVLPTRASRYMFPLYPLMTFAFLTGGRWLGSLVPRAGLRPDLVSASAAVLLVVSGLVRDITAPPPPTFATVPDVQGVREVLRREHAARPDVRVAIFAPRVLTWMDGLTTTSLFDAPPDEMIRVLRDQRITHVVNGDAGTFAIGASGVSRMIATHPESFRKLFANDSFQVYAVVDSPMVHDAARTQR